MRGTLEQSEGTFLASSVIQPCLQHYMYVQQQYYGSRVAKGYTYQQHLQTLNNPSPGGSRLSRRSTNSFFDPVLFWPSCCALLLNLWTDSASSSPSLLMVLVLPVVLVLIHSPSLSRNVTLQLLDAPSVVPVGSCDALLAEAPLSAVVVVAT